MNFVLESHKDRRTMTGSYISKRGYVLRKDKLSLEELTLLKSKLRGYPLTDEKYSKFNKVDTSFPVYVETKNKIYIPKMYGLQQFGACDKEMSNYVGEAWGTDIKFNGNLLSHQLEPVNILIDELKSRSGGGILSLQTGMGKSVCALYALSKLKRKTIIVVNKIALLKQWESEIKTFLPDAKVGVLQGQKNVDIEGKDIIVAMLQSLAKIDYPDALFEGISCTVVDEVHNTCSKVFSKVLMKICSKYTIGLSATPKRSDGCEYVFKWFLGEIVYQSSVVRKGLPPIVQTIKIDSAEYKEICSINKITGQKQILYSTMINDLVRMEKRNKLILQMIKHFVNKDNRKVLVLSDRREHLKCLKKYFDDDQSVTFTYGLFLGQMKIADLEKSKASNVILASFQAFGEGVSEKDLDTLILSTPKKFIGHLKFTGKNESGKLEQIVGRIFRKDHVERSPLIVDIQDNFSIYKSQSKQRTTFYKQHFKTVLFKEQQVNLDDHSIEDIDIDCLKTKKDQTIVNECTGDDANIYEQFLVD